MDNSGSSIKPFRRLRWRLTFSYTLVTVAALVVVELAVLGLLLLILNSDLLARTITETIRDDIVPDVGRYLESTPPDVAGLNNFLESVISDSVATGGDGRRITQGLSIEFDQNFQIFVVDAGGLLVAQAAEGYTPSHLGESFDMTAMPQLASLLPAALAGDGDIDSFYTTTPGNDLHMALPVMDQNSQVLGALIVRLQLPSFTGETLGPFALLVLLSVIPITLAAGLVGTAFGFLTARGLTRRIESLATTADRWRLGDFSMMVPDKSDDELGQLSQRLNVMAEQLQNLLHSRQELAGIEERNRLARELHDSVKQQVFATTMQIGAARALLPGDAGAAQTHLAEAEELSRRSQEELALLIQELRPAALERDGLGKALEEYTVDWARQTGIQAQVRVGEHHPLPTLVEQTLFRIAQEALANVARHSAAQNAIVSLVYEDDQVLLSIVDDGRGFDSSAEESPGYGLESMRQRAESLGGRLVIESKPGRGVSVQVRIPAGAGD